MVKEKRIRCPSCKGSGKFFAEKKMACMWCKGRRSLAKGDALRWANQGFMLAGGGYIAGDHDLADCRRMEAESEAVYHKFSAVPPWRKDATNA